MDDANLEQSVADIVREIDGDKLFSGCGLGLKECSEDHPCPIHNEFKHIRQAIKTMLEESRIQLFVENLDLKLTFLKQ
jgi:DNA-binding IscR family transcriptional regulator